MVFKKKGFNDYEVFDDYAKIYIYRRNGEKIDVLVDIEDIDKLRKLGYRWYISYENNITGYYVHTNFYINGFHYNRKIETFIMDCLDDNFYATAFVDHIDHNQLNNRKFNLRVTTNIFNSKNRKAKNKNNKSGHRNVCKIKNRWCVQMQVDGENTMLKTFPLDRLEEASLYAEKMRQELYGDFAGKS